MRANRDKISLRTDDAHADLQFTNRLCVWPVDGRIGLTQMAIILVLSSESSLLNWTMCIRLWGGGVASYLFNNCLVFI